MVNLVSLCGDVCTVFKRETGFHLGTRAFKHQQIKARGFVPGTMDCCQFNVVSSEMWMMLLFFSCLDDPVGLPRLQCWGGRFSLWRRVSSSVFDLRLSTHYLAVAFLFFFAFWVHPAVLNLFRFTHTLLWGRWCNKCPTASFPQCFSTIVSSLLHIISVDI